MIILVKIGAGDRKGELPAIAALGAGGKGGEPKCSGEEQEQCACDDTCAATVHVGIPRSSVCGREIRVPQSRGIVLEAWDPVKRRDLAKACSSLARVPLRHVANALWESPAR